MKRKTIEKMAMYRNVLAVLKSNPSYATDMPVLGSAINRLTIALDKLDAALYSQETAIHGVNVIKMDYFTELREAVITLKQALYLVGKSTNNTALLERHKQAPSAIRRMKPASLEIACKELLTDLTTYATNVALFGITPAMVQDFESKMESFEEFVISFRQAVITRSKHTNDIAALETEIFGLLRDEMDRYLLLVKNAYPELYRLYKGARKVITQRGKAIDRDSESGGATAS